MLSWPDALCERLVAGGRRVIRYDVRDTGRSESYPPGLPGYSLADLVSDAVGVLDATSTGAAHVAGLATGGWIAQLLALGHPERVATLTLIASRPNPPGLRRSSAPCESIRRARSSRHGLCSWS